MRNDLLWIAACAGCAAALTVFLSAGGVKPLQSAMQWTSTQAQTAAIFFVQSISAAQIQDEYRSVPVSRSLSGVPEVAVPAERVRVLIVAGHQPEKGGTEFGGVREREVVADIVDALVELLSQNPHYEAMAARTKTAWNPILQSYFDTHKLEIDTFMQSQKTQMESRLADGSILPQADTVYHLTVPSAAAIQLYGINKWASDNRYDITIHLHINDDAEHRPRVAGKYNGFAVYIPDHQYSNAEASRAIGEKIAARLNAYHATSTLPIEDAGVVEDQQLIAIGSNNTADGAALLIEYGYIYEPQFQSSSIRQLAIADYAFQTYLGLQDFFDDPIVTTYGSVSFPYDWTKVTGARNEKGPSVYALQAALRHLGYYPPTGRSFSDCPISGVAGPCTRAAITAYQKAHSLAGTGRLGPETRAILEKELATP